MRRWKLGAHWDSCGPDSRWVDTLVDEGPDLAVGEVVEVVEVVPPQPGEEMDREQLIDAVRTAMAFQAAMTRIQTQAAATRGEVASLSKGILNLQQSVAVTDERETIARALWDHAVEQGVDMVADWDFGPAEYMRSIYYAQADAVLAALSVPPVVGRD